ncbi:MAG TPA: hypothetical protein VJH71_00695 [Candidatus Paceibacterota bacterium]
MEIINPLNKKLNILRGAEGEINSEAIEIFRSLDDKFKRYDWYIGLSPMGSTARGYVVNGSDIDCKLVYDSPKISRSEVIKTVKLVSGETERSHGLRAGHISVAYITEFNPDKIRKGLLSVGQEYTNSVLTIRDLSGIVIGKTPEKYRDIVRGILANLSTEDRQRFTDQIVEFIITEERLAEQKLAQRTRMSQQKLTELWENRRKLWIKRINAIWFIGLSSNQKIR